MAKFTFTCEDDFPIVAAKRTVEFNSDSLAQVIEEFENFLRGCGFSFRGQLDFIDDSEYEDTEPDWNTPREKINFDFSEIPQNNWPFDKVKSQSQGVPQPDVGLYDEMDYGPAVTIQKSSR